MKNSRIKQIAVPSITLLIICLVTTALLGFTDMLTREPIAQVNAAIALESREQVCPDAVEFEQVEISLEDSSAEVYKALDGNGAVIGYAVSTSARGYGGDILVMTGIDALSGQVSAVNVYDNSGETPGLGANTSQQSFVSQFAGVDAAQGFVVSKNASKEPDKHSVDAVTGATISSTAVTAAVNEALEIYTDYLGEEG